MSNLQNLQLLRLLTSEPALKILTHLAESPKTSLPYHPQTSREANKMARAGWLKVYQEGTKRTWKLTEQAKGVLEIIGKLKIEK